MPSSRNLPRSPNEPLLDVRNGTISRTWLAWFHRLHAAITNGSTRVGSLESIVTGAPKPAALSALLSNAITGISFRNVDNTDYSDTSATTGSVKSVRLSADATDDGVATVTLTYEHYRTPQGE